MFEADTLPALRLSELPLPIRYVAALAFTALATIVALAVDGEMTVPNLSLVFVVPVIICAVGFGLGPSIVSAVSGTLAFNFFLTEPRYTLRVDNPANIWAIGLLFAVAIIASTVASTSQRRSDQIALRERQAVVLQAYVQELLAAESRGAIASTTATVLDALFKVPAIVLLMEEGTLRPSASAGGVVLRESESKAASASLEVGAAVRSGAYPADGSRFDFWPIATPHLREGVIGLSFERGRPPAPDTLVEVIGGCLALALDRARILNPQ